MVALASDGAFFSRAVGGNRFSKFKTRKGKKVTALGVLFNFTGQAKGVTVQSPAAMVNEVRVRFPVLPSTSVTDALASCADLVRRGHPGAP